MIKSRVPGKAFKKFILKHISVLCVFIIFTTHFIWATVYYIENREVNQKISDSLSSGYGLLLIIYFVYVFGVFYVFVLKPHIFPSICKRINILKETLKLKYASAILSGLILTCCITFTIYDSRNEVERLIAIAGLILFIVVGFAVSNNKAKIQWNTIIWGVTLQFLFGIITIRWDVGSKIFDVLGDKVNTFLSYTDAGTSFVYGNFLVHEIHALAFSSLPVVFFLGFMINVLYHYEIMQKFVSTLGGFLHWVMGTSVCESFISAGNIFLGQVETPLLIKPYLNDLTDSEIHSILTAGLATVSGGNFAAYIAFGANSSDLITSSVMSAPASLCYSKLIYPETDEVKITKKNVNNIKCDDENGSLLSAACKGATDSFYIISGIIANLIAFISFMYFINGVLTWYGQLVGFVDSKDHWTINLILAKIFTPISYLMGVPWEDCEKVAELVGIKISINNMIAFKRLGEMNLGKRSKTIATYAICGFGNPGGLGIGITALTTLMPNKRESVFKAAFRAFFGSTMVCLMTACVAGTLVSS